MLSVTQPVHFGIVNLTLSFSGHNTVETQLIKLILEHLE